MNIQSDLALASKQHANRMIVTLLDDNYRTTVRRIPECNRYQFDHNISMRRNAVGSFTLFIYDNPICNIKTERKAVTFGAMVERAFVQRGLRGRALAEYAINAQCRDTF